MADHNCDQCWALVKILIGGISVVFIALMGSIALWRVATNNHIRDIRKGVKIVEEDDE